MKCGNKPGAWCLNMGSSNVSLFLGGPGVNVIPIPHIWRRIFEGEPHLLASVIGCKAGLRVSDAAALVVLPLPFNWWYV
jgi:hypothetical protein